MHQRAHITKHSSRIFEDQNSAVGKQNCGFGEKYASVSDFSHYDVFTFPRCFGTHLDVLLYVQLKNESQSLDNWMTDVQKFLTAEDIGWGDADVIEAQLEQSNVHY